MLEKLIGLLAVWIMSVISSMGYGGIVLLMAIESACIPLPSEIIMPFAGYLVFKSEMVLWIVAFMGALGCVLGSIPAYYIGKTGGRNLTEKYGRFVLISKKDLKMALAVGGYGLQQYGDCPASLSVQAAAHHFNFCGGRRQ